MGQEITMEARRNSMTKKAGIGKRKINNLVAKHSGTFNRSSVQRDRTKFYKKYKHKGQDLDSNE